MFELFGAVLTLAFLSDTEGSSAAKSRIALKTLLELSERGRSRRYTFYVVHRQYPDGLEHGWHVLDQGMKLHAGIDKQILEMEEALFLIDSKLKVVPTEHLLQLLRTKKEALEVKLDELYGQQGRITFQNASPEVQLEVALDQGREDLELQNFRYLDLGESWHEGLGSGVRRDPDYRWLAGWIPVNPQGVFSLAGTVSIYGDPDWDQISDDDLMGLFEDEYFAALRPRPVSGRVEVVGLARPGQTWEVDPSEFEILQTRRLLGLPVSDVRGDYPDRGRPGFKKEFDELSRLVKKERWLRIYNVAKGEWLAEDLPKPRPTEM